MHYYAGLKPDSSDGRALEPDREQRAPYVLMCVAKGRQSVVYLRASCFCELHAFACAIYR